MKIIVHLTVEIDPEDWTLAFGTSQSEIRDDVKTYVADLATGGVFSNGEVDATITLAN